MSELPSSSSRTKLSGNNEAATMDQDPEETHGICAYILIFCSIIFTIIFPFSLLTAINVVSEYERAVIFRLGRVRGGDPKGPGLFFLLPCVDAMKKVDLRTKTFDVPPQEILTKDSVTVKVDAVVFYRVSNPKWAVIGVDDFDVATRLLAQTSLRNALGTRSLSEILSHREEISAELQQTMDPPTDKWGVKVERVEIKDVALPYEMQRSMAAEAEASREARAKIIAAEGERSASRALKEAADVMVESPATLQLRYLQTLTTISAEKNSTIVFPLPMELLKTFPMQK